MRLTIRWATLAACSIRWWDVHCSIWTHFQWRKFRLMLNSCQRMRSNRSQYSRLQAPHCLDSLYQPEMQTIVKWNDVSRMEPYRLYEIGFARLPLVEFVVMTTIRLGPGQMSLDVLRHLDCWGLCMNRLRHYWQLFDETLPHSKRRRWSLLFPIFQWKTIEAIYGIDVCKYWMCTSYLI